MSIPSRFPPKPVCSHLRRCHRAGQRRPWLLAVVLLPVCLACTGERGPAGVQGPAGECLGGATYVARFDRPTDLATWLFGPDGSWELADGRLVLQSGPAARMTAGPATWFSHDLDIAVEVEPVTMGPDTHCGLRFHVGEAGAYEASIGGDGTCQLRWEDAAQQTGVLFYGTTPTPLPRVLRVLRRGTEIRLYLDGTRVASGSDLGLHEGYVQLFVEGSGTVAFDNVWVGTALLLQ